MIFLVFVVVMFPISFIGGMIAAAVVDHRRRKRLAKEVADQQHKSAFML